MGSNNEALDSLAVPLLSFADLVGEVLDFLDSIEDNGFSFDEAPFSSECIDSIVW